MRPRVGLVVDSRGGVTAWDLDRAVTSLRRRGIPPAAMPTGYDSRLSTAEIDAIVDYILDLPG